MSDVDPNTQIPESQSLTHGDSPLEHIVDDTEERAECREWIYREFVDGRDADSLLEELVSGGWLTDDAEAMVEEGRRATRHLRGVVTREEVARVAEQRYRNSFRIAFRMAIGGLPLMCVHFLVSMMSTGRIPWPDRVLSARRRMDANSSPPEPDGSKAD